MACRKFQLGGAKDEEVQQVSHVEGGSDSDEGAVWDSSSGGNQALDLV